MSDEILALLIASGPDNIRWFYNLKEWVQVRKQVLALDGGLCVRCRRKGITKPAQCVHHKKSVRDHPKLALSVWYKTPKGRRRNLVSLCRDCHEELHNRK